MSEIPMGFREVTVVEVMGACEVLLHAGFTEEGMSVLAQLGGFDARTLTDASLREEYLAALRRKREKAQR